MSHLPAHSIRFSSTHSIQMHPFHFDSSLPRSPRRMLNKHAKQSQRMKRNTHHYSLFRHQLQSSPPFSSCQYPRILSNPLTISPQRRESISPFTVNEPTLTNRITTLQMPILQKLSLHSTLSPPPISITRCWCHDSCLRRLLLLSSHPFNASKHSINMS